MTLRSISVFALLMMSCFQLQAQQELTLADRKELRQALRKMREDDELYRHQIALENDKKKIEQLWKLQAVNDSINKIKLLDLIKRYGYPSSAQTGTDDSEVMSQHFTTERDSALLYAVFESQMKKGNMPPEEFAKWYDRWRVNRKQSTWYGTYGAGSIKREELVLINKRRRTLGLPDMKP